MRLYRALLHFCPSAFRAEYGEEMCAIFSARRADASSPLAAVVLWLETVADLLITAAAAHADVLRRDLRYGVRTLGRSPGFAATAILVTALGIGATTATFSITDHVLLRPLPFPQQDRLVELWEDQSPVNYSTIEPSPPNYRDWKRSSKAFEGMAAFRGLSVDMLGNGDPEQIDGASATADLFPMLGAQPALGRIFGPEDDHSGAPGTVVLSYGFWQRRFAGDSSVLGRKVVLDGEPYTIVGVMPRNFFFPDRACELWTPMRFANTDFEDRTNNYLHVIAKLRPGVSIAQARAEMRLISAELKREYPKDNAHVSVTVESLRDAVLSRSPGMLLMALLGASLCVLLTACTNLANLLLARTMRRRKELAVRTALGAGREQLARQMLTESGLLAIFGGALGVVFAITAAPLLGRLIPAALPVAQTPVIDSRILLFALALTFLTAVGFGVVPALRVCAGVDVAGLHEGSRGGIGGRRERLRATLVVAEVAASVVLLISAGLLIRALLRIEKIDPGFRADGVLTMRTSLPMPKYENTARRVAFYSSVLSGIRQIPGVKDAAYTSFLPLVMRGGIWPVTIQGQAPRDPGFRQVSMRFITPGFFPTMGIPLLAGRDVSDADTLHTRMAAVVSESFVHKYWPHENPLGREFQVAFSVRSVVGVVGNVRVRGLERSSEPQVYLPYRQVPDGSIIWYAPKDLVVRSSLDTRALLPAIRRIVAKADPQQPISDVQTLAGIVDAETTPRLIQLRMLGTFAALALLLAAIGIHGLLSFAVSNRKQEIGVRVAMGARSSDIVGMVMREGFALAIGGIVFGVALAYAAARGMQALLAGVKPDDGITFSAAIAVALVMTLLGSLLPALRAMRLDPMAAIRAD